MYCLKQFVCCIVVFCHMQLFSCAYNFVQYHLIDTSRQELYPHDDAHPYREFMMHMWIPVTEKPCPLILFSHGLGNNFNGMTYTRLCQYCASYGYVVASVSHSYACKNIQFSDGRTAPYLFPALFHQHSGRHIFDIEADWWFDDMIYALDECVRQNNDTASLVYKKIDVSRIGVMGHSLGGSVAIQLCRSDAKVKAVINLDGPLYGVWATVPVEKPLLMLVGVSSISQLSLFTGGVPFHKEFVWRYYFNEQSLPALKMLAASSAQAQIIFIDKIVHGSFSDEALSVDPVIAPFVLNGEQAHAIIFAHVRDFFETYLCYQPSS